MIQDTHGCERFATALYDACNRGVYLVSLVVDVLCSAIELFSFFYTSSGAQSLCILAQADDITRGLARIVAAQMRSKKSCGVSVTGRESNGYRTNIQLVTGLDCAAACSASAGETLHYAAAASIQSQQSPGSFVVPAKISASALAGTHATISSLCSLLDQHLVFILVLELCVLQLSNTSAQELAEFLL